MLNINKTDLTYYCFKIWIFCISAFGMQQLQANFAITLILLDKWCKISNKTMNNTFYNLANLFFLKVFIQIHSLLDKEMATSSNSLVVMLTAFYSRPHWRILIFTYMFYVWLLGDYLIFLLIRHWRFMKTMGRFLIQLILHLDDSFHNNTFEKLNYYLYYHLNKLIWVAVSTII